MASIYLAGGCFWGVEELFRNLEGVTGTIVGYTGGTTESPTYETVKTGRTGHAEALKIDYDPQVIPPEKLLHFFFSIHDPTTVNQQGNDRGSQYRSAIFYQDSNEKEVSEKVIADLTEQKRWPRPIVTSLEPFSEFYSAEAFHQDYLQKNPGGYTCHWQRYSVD